MDVFVQYVAARTLRETRDMSYRAYVTRSLQLIPQYGHLSTSWLDAVQSAKEQPRDMSADDVIDHVVARLERL